MNSFKPIQQTPLNIQHIRDARLQTLTTPPIQHNNLGGNNNDNNALAGLSSIPPQDDRPDINDDLGHIHYENISESEHEAIEPAEGKFDTVEDYKAAKTKRGHQLEEYTPEEFDLQKNKSGTKPYYINILFKEGFTRKDLKNSNGKFKTVQWMKDKIQELQEAKEGSNPSKKRKLKNTHVIDID